MSTTSSQTQLVGDLHKCNYYILCRHRVGRKLIRESGTNVSHGSSRSSTPRNGEFLPDLQTVTAEVVEAADVLDGGRTVTPRGNLAGDAPQRVAGPHDLGRQLRGVGRLAGLRHEDHHKGGQHDQQAEDHDPAASGEPECAGLHVSSRMSNSSSIERTYDGLSDTQRRCRG